MKRFLIGALKLGISFSLLAYLFYMAWRDESFAELRAQPKQWDLLLAALLVALFATFVTFVRWHLLVRALHLPFRMRDAFRFGFIGFLFNFFTLGIIGGDVLKAVFIARQQHGRRAEAVATVVVDRVIGLYALFLIAAAAFLSVDLDANVRDPNLLASVERVCQATFAFTILGAIGFVALLLPSFTSGPLWEWVVQIPRVGVLIRRMIEAVRMYRRQLPLVGVAMVMSLFSHVLFTIAVYLVARGLPGNEPSLATHFVIVPIANVAGALPLPGGLGAFEYALDVLYRGVSSVDVAERQGFIIALAYRVITILIALIGVVFYLFDRREVVSLIHEAEEETQTPGDTPLPAAEPPLPKPQELPTAAD